MKWYFLLFLMALSQIGFGQERNASPEQDVAVLLGDLWEDPILFEREGKMQTLIDDFQSISSQDLQQILKRVFEDNNGMIKNGSRAKKGTLGNMNRRSNFKRKKKFDQKMKKGFRDMVSHPDNKVILAEGDSWFQFPFILKDIVDQLEKRDDYALMSLAYGGEWLSNILRENNYLKYYLELKPDVILMSGGGNDLVGDRLSSLVDLPETNPLTEKYMKGYRDYLITRLSDLPNSPPFNDYCLMPAPIKNELEERRDSLNYDHKLVDILMHGRTFLNDRFYVLLTLHKLQYYLFLENLKKADPVYFRDKLKIITQGYDYPIPSFKKGNHLGQIFLNVVNDSGHWLKLPLMTKGITSDYDQRAVMAVIIFEFNEMLIDIVTDPRYAEADLYLIDCRGAIAQLSAMNRYKYYWNDEMHPSSSIFKKIAVAYANCIDGKEEERVVRLLKLMQPPTE